MTITSQKFQKLYQGNAKITEILNLVDFLARYHSIEIIIKKSILLLSSELQNDVTRLVLSTLGGSDSDENGRIESDSESEDKDDEEYEEEGSDRIDSF